ncbi:MAG: YncE family protein, partial [Candidatus Eremiobacteraeota bacterium]|nr:YncE family protein [Candidatus Eremiobacteraeota bacterium]
FDPEKRGSPGYVAASLAGSIRRIDLNAIHGDDDAYANVERYAAAPSQTVVRTGGPIKHVIYVIKENRSYDQVLGDLKIGDGDPNLVLFGQAVTPNQHALARRFGVLDRAFTNSQVSADGHNWSTAAFANDYLERYWPPQYGGRRDLYDFEDGAVASVPRGGYLWDAAARANVTFRDYGEFVTNPTSPGGDVTTHMEGLRDRFSPKYPGFDLRFDDLDREKIWLAEFRDYERNGNLPALEIVRLPNDHTAGTRPGALTPQAYVAQNDAALGKLVDAVSHSRYWHSTAIFSVEDDAQNGPDHVDDQRSTFYVISPYARGGVVHEHYSTASVLRTIEVLLGLTPMSIYDTVAPPMYAAFGTTARLQPFSALPPHIDITARNAKTAYGAQESARMDFDDADAVDPDRLNAILWHAVHDRRKPAR